MMLSFHNDLKVKQKYLDRLEAHQKADAIVQRCGWDGSKGCAVGCTLEDYSHSQYPIELGLPEWLARLEDKIHEGLPLSKAKKWPKQFLEAIPVGINEEQFDKLYHSQAILRQNRNLKLQQENLDRNPRLKNIIERVIEAIKKVIKYHEDGLNSGRSEEKAESAWLAAESAEATWLVAYNQEAEDLLGLLKKLKFL